MGCYHNGASWTAIFESFGGFWGGGKFYVEQASGLLATPLQVSTVLYQGLYQASLFHCGCITCLALNWRYLLTRHRAEMCKQAALVCPLFGLLLSSFHFGNPNLYAHLMLGISVFPPVRHSVEESQQSTELLRYLTDVDFSCVNSV